MDSICMKQEGSWLYVQCSLEGFPTDDVTLPVVKQMHMGEESAIPHSLALGADSSANASA